MKQGYRTAFLLLLFHRSVAQAAPPVFDPPTGQYRFVRTKPFRAYQFELHLRFLEEMGGFGQLQDRRLLQQAAQRLDARKAAGSGAARGVFVQYEANHFLNFGETRRTFTTHLPGLNGRLALNPCVQLIGFYQRNTTADRNVYNVGLSWEYRPLSYLFVVFNSNQRSLRHPVNRLRQEQVIAKLTFLKQF